MWKFLKNRWANFLQLFKLKKNIEKSNSLKCFESLLLNIKYSSLRIVFQIQRKSIQTIYYHFKI